MNGATRQVRFDVVVLGSVHMDLIATAPVLPRHGESTLGSGFAMHPGGKAGNQAVAAARHGARTAIVARVGEDAFGNALREALSKQRVDVSLLQADTERATGVSPVLMSDSGEYSSIIVPGASMALVTELPPAQEAINSCAVLMLQLEIGKETIAAAARSGLSAGAQVILNASPVSELSDLAACSIWRFVDILIVNRFEAETLLPESTVDEHTRRELATRLQRLTGVASVIVTLGSDGAVLANASTEFHVPGYDVSVVDTLGAGDAFAGAVGAAVARGEAIEEAVVLANAAGALAVSRVGAHEASPSLAETRSFLAARNKDGR